MRANGQVVEIRNHDLRFTLDEIVQYVHRMWPTKLSQSELQLLEQKTEGWIAGLQLATLSLRQLDNVQTVLGELTGTNVDIAEYFMDEVLSRQPNIFYQFQLRMSILDRFCAALCAAIAPDLDPDWTAEAVLDWLAHGNLFIIPLDAQKVWYRYHHLYKDLLQSRLLATFNEDEVAELHRRAAKWLAQADFLVQAVNHALTASDFDLVEQIIRETLPVILNREDRTVLHRWLNILPETLVNGRPELLMLKVWSLQYSWQPEVIAGVIKEVELLLEQEERTQTASDHRQVLFGQIALFKAQAAYSGGQATLAVTYSRAAFNLLPTAWILGRGAAVFYLGVSMHALGESFAAEQMLRDLYEPLAVKANAYGLRILMALGFNYMAMGRLVQVEQTANLMLQLAIENRLLVAQGWAYLMLGMVYYQWNQLDMAEKQFHKIVDIRYMIHAIAARQGIAGAILVHQATGRQAEAWQMWDLLCRYDLEIRGHMNDEAEPLHALLMIADDEVENALRWATAYNKPVDHTLLIMMVLPQLIQSQILMASEDEADISQALQLLDEVETVAKLNHVFRRQIEVMALRALALNAMGKKQRL
ncbi:MAG: hypothetical protein HC804_07395 [Anaerolineae bacterium]|nr:hypothetical protein [Anaerolineae bacterium]